MSVNEKMTAIADAIRGKTGGTEPLTLDQMAAEIAGIQGGGGTSAEDSILSRTLSGEYRNNRITVIGNYGLFNCTGLTSVELPALTSIGDYGMGNCTGLTSVELPALTSIGGNTFRGCSAIEHLSFPKLEDVNNKYNFIGCGNLETVDFPSVKKIGHEKQFEQCLKFYALILRGNTIPTIHVYALTSSTIESGNGYVYVPASLVETYKVATNWSVYADKFRALEDYTVDGTITGELDMSKI